MGILLTFANSYTQAAPRVQVDLGLVDDQIEALWPALVTYQEDYRFDQGYYYQLLWSDGMTPVQPDDQAQENIYLYVPGLTGLPGVHRIDVYERSTGVGFILEVEVGEWYRKVNFGPDVNRNQDWTLRATEVIT